MHVPASPPVFSNYLGPSSFTLREPTDMPSFPFPQGRDLAVYRMAFPWRSNTDVRHVRAEGGSSRERLEPWSHLHCLNGFHLERA